MLDIRQLGPDDQAMHVSLWDPPPAPMRPREVLINYEGCRFGKKAVCNTYHLMVARLALSS